MSDRAGGGQSLAGQSVLVTGAAGFIGSAVVRALRSRGARVTGIGHGAWTGDPGPDAVFIRADVTLEALRGSARRPDIVVHCAGPASVGASFGDPSEDFTRSVVTCHAVLDYMRQCAPQARLVLCSSAAVYGAGHAAPIPENAATQPVSPYGLHKDICERLVRFHARTWALQAVIVRLFSVYGEGLKRQLLWDASCKLSRGERSFSGGGDEVRDWIHVADAAEILVDAAAHASPEVPACNAGTGRGTRVRDALRDICRALGITERLEFDGMVRPGDPAYLVAAITRSESWGWAPKTTLSEGLVRYARWFSAQGVDAPPVRQSR